MFGYKAFNRDMTCRGFQYKENEEYTHKGYFGLCDKGFHFCRKLEDCFRYYSRYDCIIHKVEVPDYVSEFNDPYDDKLVTNRIRILDRVYESLVSKTKKLSKISEFFLLLSDKKLYRFLVAKQGDFLNTLYKDSDWEVRLEVARHGSHLDDLFDDPDWRVRLEIARQGSHLDELYLDPEYMVRLEVARQGAHLDELYLDPEYMVRSEVVKHGFSPKQDEESNRVMEVYRYYKKIEPYFIK